jgi:hypothetical protein
MSETPPIRVAFSAMDDWPASIRANLDARYAPVFVDLATADLDSYDVVVPLLRRDSDVLARRPDLFGRKFFHPSAGTSALCHDKLALARFLIAEGFAAFTPPLRSPGPPYPYVWKRRQGASGRDCHVVGGPDAERGLDLADEAWFAQSLAVGEMEYAVHVLRAGGEIRYISTVTYEMAAPALVRGERASPHKTLFQRGSPHQDLFGDILGKLDYDGVACFNFKLVDGAPRIFEINPRFGGSLVMDVTAFVDAYRAALAHPDASKKGG